MWISCYKFDGECLLPFERHLGVIDFVSQRNGLNYCTSFISDLLQKKSVH